MRIELVFDESVRDHLRRHGLFVEDAYDVAAGPYKIFRDKGYHDGVMMIGPDCGGRLLTFIITAADEANRRRIITGWPSSRGKRTQYERPGGTRRA